MKNQQLAVIGSGATAIYCLKHILDHSEVLLQQFKHISIFEKDSKMGFGMPYNPETTDIYNLSNISSEEIPELPDTFANWLRKLDQKELKKLHINTFPIKDSEVYSRIALGHYFHEQFKVLVKNLRLAGFIVIEYTNYKIIDIKVKDEYIIELISEQSTFLFSKLLIATGHHMSKHDNPKIQYYDSPWPIHKILPKSGAVYNFDIGILGASLSAFDVVTSLAHRHGTFIKTGKILAYKLHETAPNFKITLHAAEGWLPHLQYEQNEPFREIYRHTTRSQLLALRDEDGFLRMKTFFDKICRPALIYAFKKDENFNMEHLLKNENFSFKDFISEMSAHHEYIDSFKGMAKELIEARESIENNKPIHWMETLDDLMYCLNFHAELLPAEDHIFFNKDVKPFLMNVIAALPIQSAEILMALYNTNGVNLTAGKVTIIDSEKNLDETQIKIQKENGSIETKHYKKFINCSGNDNVTLDNFPFKSLVNSDFVRSGRARFSTTKSKEVLEKTIAPELIISEKNKLFLDLGGIDVDGFYRIINRNGKVYTHIHDLAFTHIYGCRPYSYGLQACNATSAIVINSWLSSEIENTQPISEETITKIYKNDNQL